MHTIIKASSLPENYIQENCFITELINTGEFPHCSVSRARVTPGNATENHVVRETDEIYYILSGTGEMEVNGSIQGMVTEGDTVFIPSNSSQRILNTGDNDLIFLCICTPRFEFRNYSAV